VHIYFLSTILVLIAVVNCLL